MQSYLPAAIIAACAIDHRIAQTAQVSSARSPLTWQDHPSGCAGPISAAAATVTAARSDPVLGYDRKDNRNASARQRALEQLHQRVRKRNADPPGGRRSRGKGFAWDTEPAIARVK